MKRTSTLKRGNGFKKVVGNSLKKSPLKKSSFKRTLSDIQKDVKESDSKFSKFIINRDKKCLRCGSISMLTCSHYHGRANYSTRFEPLNCVCFCTECHSVLESKKKEGMEYHQFMIEYLGEDQFFVLDHLSKMDISKADSLILAHNLLSKVETTSDIQY
jgi:hypothetical protein